MENGTSGWEKVKLGTVAKEVRVLYEPQAGEEIPYVGLEHIEQQTLRLSGVGCSSEVQSTKKRFEADDVLFGSLRPYFRKVARPRVSGVCSTDITVLRAQPGMEQDFLFYFIAHDKFIDHATSASSGTRMPRANWKVMAQSEWMIPPPPTQRKIVALLGTYDDLIENNTRRLQVLEEVAQSLYREWFVEMRFPGHENATTTNSKLGPIPHGWQVVTLNDAMELAYGRALVAQTRQPGAVPVYGSSGVTGFHDKALIKGPGIIVGRKGNVGTVFWSDKDFFPIDTVYYVKTEICLHYVFFNLQRQQFLDSDAAVPGLSRGQAYLLPFLLPKADVLSRFQEVVEPIFEQIKNLNGKNSNLRRTRDLLLPKLLSGALDVSGLDIEGVAEDEELALDESTSRSQVLASP